MLEKKLDADKLTPSKALDKINNLRQPESDNKQAITAFKQERRNIADKAVKESKPPKFEDFLKSGLNGATASLEFSSAKQSYNSQINKLKQISQEAHQYPDKILAPDEAVVKINELPRPDRNNTAEIQKYNQTRANIADAVLMYKQPSPTNEDFGISGKYGFNRYEYQEAVTNHNEYLGTLKQY